MLSLLSLLLIAQVGQSPVRIPERDWKPVMNSRSGDPLNLSHRTFASFSPRGDVVVVDDSRQRVVIVDGRTGAVRRLGRDGSGPGEFRHIVAFGWRADTLWAGDDRTARLTFFPGSDPKRVTTTPFLPVSNGIEFMSQPEGLVSDDRVVGYLLPTRARRLGEVPSPIPMVLTGRSPTGTWDTITTLYSDNRSYTLPTGNGSIKGAQPMSDADLWSVSRNGRYLATLDRNDKRLSRDKTAILVVHHLPDRTHRRTMIPIVPERITVQEIDRLVTNRVESFNEAIGRELMSTAALRKVLFVPFWRSPFVDLVVEDDGRILLRRNDWAGTRASYVMLDDQGRIQKEFEIDANIQIRSFQANRLLGVRENDDGSMDLVVARVPGLPTEASGTR